jgi:hypothetical protein
LTIGPFASLLRLVLGNLLENQIGKVGRTSGEAKLTCSRVGMILSRYKSGPLPKPIKILPSVPNLHCILGDTTTLDVLTIGPFAGLLRLVLGNLLERWFLERQS